MFKTIIATVQKQISDRRRYLRAIAEIDSMSQRDLSDIRADPAEMRQQIWNDIYG
jgi:hypothetical protein